MPEQNSRPPSRIMQPGQVSVNVSYQDGPLAQPTTLTLNDGRGNVHLVVVGGLSKVEALAGVIAGGLSAGLYEDSRTSESVPHPVRIPTIDAIGTDAVLIAEAVLKAAKDGADEAT